MPASTSNCLRFYPGTAPSPSLSHPKSPQLSPHHGLDTWVPSQGSCLPPAKPPGWGMGPRTLAPQLPSGLPGSLQLPRGKHLLLSKQLGKLRHKAARAVPRLQGTDLVRCHPSACLVPPLSGGCSPPQGITPILHQDLAPPAPGAVLCASQGVTTAMVPGGPRTPGSWGPRVGGKTRMLAVAAPGVSTPPWGCGRWGLRCPSDYVQPTNKYRLPWEGEVRVSVCVCAWMCIYIYIYL